MKRKRLLLWILLGILGLSLTYCYWAFPRQRRISQAGPAPVVGGQGANRGPVRQPAAVAEDTRLHLELLKGAEGGSIPGYKRNIFGSVEPPPPPPPPAPKVAAPPAGPPTPPPVATPVQQELAHFNFLGYLEKDGKKTVFLSRDQNLFLVHQGSRFGARQEFTVTELTPEKLVIQTDNDSRQIVVPLVENQPLIPSFRPGGTETRGGSLSPTLPRGSFTAPQRPGVLPPGTPATGRNPARPDLGSPPVSAPPPAPVGVTPDRSSSGSPAAIHEVGQ